MNAPTRKEIDKLIEQMNDIFARLEEIIGEKSSIDDAVDSLEGVE